MKNGAILKKYYSDWNKSKNVGENLSMAPNFPSPTPILLISNFHRKKCEILRSVKFGWLQIANFEWILSGTIFQFKMHYSHWSKITIIEPQNRNFAITSTFTWLYVHVFIWRQLDMTNMSGFNFVWTIKLLKEKFDSSLVRKCPTDTNVNYNSQ